MKALASAALAVAMTGATCMIVALAACSGGQGSAGGPSCPNLEDCPATTPSWSGQVEPIVDTYCATPQCHGDGGIESAQYDFSTYAGVHGHYLPMLVQVSQCEMPPGDASPPATPLPDDLRLTLFCWLEAMGPDN